MQRRRDEVETGPALRGEQVSECWVWIWSAIDHGPAEARAPERDEASRLAVAFDRAIDWQRGGSDTPAERFVRDQTPRATARLAHYLLTRREQWGARTGQEARRRLQVIIDASLLLGRLLGMDLEDFAPHCARLGITLERGSVFSPSANEGITIESVEEGPALPAERNARETQARALFTARWQAERERPKRRRQLEEVTS